jgi:DNA polymerase elongation subunit (family B)
MAQSTTKQQNKLKVLHTCSTWKNGEELVWVKYETPEGSKTVEVKYEWYFLVHCNDQGKLSALLSTTLERPKLERTGDYLKVYAQDRDLRTKLVLLLENNGITTYEGDLLLDKRWYIDHEIEIGTTFKKLYFDIETDDTSPIITVGKDRILSFAAVDDQGKTYFEVLEDNSDEAEEKLLIKFLKLVRKYDIILGWNSSGFDIPYLKERMKKYELNKHKDYKWREFAKYDLLKRFRHIFRFDSHIKSFSLEFVSNHFLGRGKIKHAEKIIELWKNNKEKLKEYNIEDCNLVKELDEKLGVSNMMIRQSQWCGVPPAQFGLYSIIDAYILKKAHGIGKYCKTSVNALKERSLENSRTHENPNDTDTEKSKYVGALVLEPQTGKYSNVYTFDFKGLYPSMMRTSNIGYDSIRYEAAADRMTNPGTLTMLRQSGIVKPTYFDKVPSVINLAISDLITKRGEYKELKLKMIEEGTNKGTDWERVVSDEIIVKELANSTYGIMGLEYGRYYSVDIAESITLFGQWNILFAKKFFENQGFNVIYGDTDSVFVSTGDELIDVDSYLEKFHYELEMTLKESYGIDKSFIQLNFDKQYDSFLLIAKKTYVGHVINIEGKKTNDLYARGLEFHKKNTFDYAAKKQKELIELVLSKNISKPELYNWSQSTRDDFYKRSFTADELTITQKVGKGVEEYSRTPPLHVRLAQKIHQETGVDLHHSEIDYIITSGSSKKSNKANGILSSEFTGEFDRDYYWENKTLPILERITKTIYPDYDAFGYNLTLF